MTRLVNPESLNIAQSQLPPDAYLSLDFAAREKQSLFAKGPRYVGHELLVPNSGDFHTLKGEAEARVLIHNNNGLELISNVCRHRQAKMLDGHGNLGRSRNIVCPLHRWTYDAQGELLGAPHFPTQPCLHLDKTPLQRWNGLLFESNGFDIAKAMAGLKVLPNFNFTDYVFDHAHVHECNYNWKTFIEVYLEDYHVVPFHPGLGQFVDCDRLGWQFGEDYSVQTVGVHSELKKPGSPVYQRWHEAVLNYRSSRYNGQQPEFGAIWLTIYPNIMIEWYPHVLVVSTLHPNGPRKTTNVVEFYYPDEIVHFERAFIEAETAAYMETCAEDDEIALRMDAGREALLRRGLNQTGPYQSPMEDGMQHFHEWIRRNMQHEILDNATDAQPTLPMGVGQGEG